MGLTCVTHTVSALELQLVFQCWCVKCWQEQEKRLGACIDTTICMARSRKPTSLLYRE